MTLLEYQHLIQKGGYLLSSDDIKELRKGLLKCYSNLPQGISTRSLDKVNGLESKI